MTAGIRLLAAALLLLPGVTTPAHGPLTAVVFDGETYVRVHAERQSSGNRIVQFLREPETFENWTQAIAYYRYATIGNDPTQAAYALRDSVRAANPDAQPRIVVHSVTRDAMVDFLTWPADGRYLEFTVVRYSRSTDGKGMVAFQFSQRFRDATKDDAEKFTKSRSSWKGHALEFDMWKVHATFSD
jgi:hypothetical protein